MQPLHKTWARLAKHVCSQNQSMLSSVFVPEVAEHRLEQDLLMACSGMRTKQLLRHITRYKTFIDEHALQGSDLARQYKALMDQAPQTFTGCGCYAPGDILEG